jgi:hypothetical protein
MCEESLTAAEGSARRGYAKWNLILLLALLAFTSLCVTGCGSSSKAATTTTSGPPPQPNYPPYPQQTIDWPWQDPASSPLPAPAAQVPPPPGANDFPLTVASPLTNTTITSPVTVVANATPKNPILFMRVYVDQLSVYYTWENSINTQIFVAPGQHTIEVMAEDNQGYISATPLSVNISSQQSQTTISSIQAMSGWQTCSALFPAGSGRAGQVCAAGLGTAVSTMTQNQSSPSMDGNSTQFSMGGPSPYSNELYFNAIAGGNNVSNFTYDLYFYIDNGNAPQALEFDVNQTFGGQRWVWGSECNFNGTGKWDIWNDLTGWQPTAYPCTYFPSNQWIHLVWQLERVGNQVHYVSLQVGDQTYPVDTYYPNQPDWTLEEIDVAFQMDGNYEQEPYNVWLDEVNLTAY